MTSSTRAGLVLLQDVSGVCTHTNCARVFVTGATGAKETTTTSGRLCTAKYIGARDVTSDESLKFRLDFLFFSFFSFDSFNSLSTTFECRLTVFSGGVGRPT